MRTGASTSCRTRCRRSPGRSCATSATARRRSACHAGCGICRPRSTTPPPSSASGWGAPRPSEIAAELQVDVELVLQGLAAQGAAHCSSLDEPAGDEEGRPGDRTRFGGGLGWTEPRFDLIEQRAALLPLLARLPERERTILALRFFEGLTQSEIGQQVGISQMHVSRLLSRTLLRLRAGLARD
jgi:DNA-directed RNA polymerase specialized sigma subunit